MKPQPLYRRSPPAAIRLALPILIGAVLMAGGLGLLAWREAEQIAALQAEVERLQAERQVTGAQLAALQSTATAMGQRLTALEADDPARQIAALQAALQTADDSQELAAVRASLEEIQTRVDGFQTALADLAARMEALQSARGELPAEVHLSVARQRQSHNLSCESSAASMAAQYHGVDLSEAEILAALPRNDNPHLGFRGNVDGPTGSLEDYGVYAGPIMAVLNARGLRAWPVTGGMEGIKAAIARGNPVIAWVTYNCLPATPVETTIEGRPVTLVAYQHTVVVTGYNAEGVWANDPYDGQEDFYSTADFERALGYFGYMAVEVASP